MRQVELGVVEARVRHLRLDVLQDGQDLGGQLHLSDARHAGRGAVACHRQVGLEHQVPGGHAYCLEGPETLQLPPCSGKGGGVDKHGALVRYSNDPTHEDIFGSCSKHNKISTNVFEVL